jgi:hypothetical protein
VPSPPFAHHLHHLGPGSPSRASPAAPRPSPLSHYQSQVIFGGERPHNGLEMSRPASSWNLS